MIFINKMQDQLLPEKACGLALPPNPTLLTVPALVSLLLGISMDTEPKTDQPSVHYTEHYGGHCAINRSDDRWSLLFSEVEKRITRHCLQRSCGVPEPAPGMVCDKSEDHTGVAMGVEFGPPVVLDFVAVQVFL
ncbi:hypothetical protein MJT46_013927 [Ovis ammon polii x Ovis aries]|nr:hypothetical protein MJT46_013927 [Ovis ammon polii x Ovis aries]